MNKTTTEPKLHKCYFCGYEKLKIETKKTGIASSPSPDLYETHTATVRCRRCHARGPTQPYTIKFPALDDNDHMSNLYRETEAKRLAAELWNNLKCTD